MMRTDHESSNTVLNFPSFHVKYRAHAHLDDHRDAVGSVLADRGYGLPDGLRVEVDAHAPVGQPDIDHDARLAVGGDDLRGLNRVEDDGAFERAGRSGRAGAWWQCS